MPKQNFQLDVPKEAKEKNFEQDYLSAAQAVLKEQAVLRLFKDGKISTGTGAKILGMNLYEFMRFMGQHKVSVFKATSKELEEDVRAAKRAIKAAPKKRKNSR